MIRTEDAVLSSNNRYIMPYSSTNHFLSGMQFQSLKPVVLMHSRRHMRVYTIYNCIGTSSVHQGPLGEIKRWENRERLL
jgi:hypothetical protein